MRQPVVWLRRVAAAALALSLTSVIAIALLLSVARLALPLTENYRHSLAAILSQQLGYQVAFDALKLRLSGWQPRLILEQFQVSAPHPAPPAFHATALELDVDVVGSWRTASPQFSHFTLVGAQLTVIRSRAGQLHLLGFEALQTQPEAVTRFLDHGQINLTASTLRFIDESRAAAIPLELTNVDLQLHNAGERHQLTVSASTEKKSPPPPLFPRGENIAFASVSKEEEKPPFGKGTLEKPPLVKGGLGGFFASAEFTGAPTAFATWDGTAQLRVHSDHLEKMLPVEWLAGATLNGGALQLESWLRIQAGRLEQALVQINAEDLRLNAVTLSRLQAQARMRRHSAGGWQIEIADLSASRSAIAASISGLNLNLLLGADSKVSRLDLIADQLELADLTALLRASPWPAPAALAPLLAASPHGRITALKLGADRPAAEQPWRWNTSVTLTAFGIAPTTTAPGVDGLDAQLTADQNGGTAQLTSAGVTLNAPTHFSAPLAFNQFAVQLDWHSIAAGGWQLAGRQLHLANADLAGDFQFELTLPPDRASPLLNLRGQVHDAQIARIPAYLLVNKLPPPLLAWLNRSLLGGRITNAEVELSGRLADYPFRDQSGQFELRLAFTDLELGYHPDWPPLTHASGVVQFHQQAIEIAVEQGRLYDSTFTHGAVQIPEPRGLQNLVIRGQLAGPFADGLRALRTTPLAAKLGQLAEGLTVSGQSRLALEIKLPLVNTAQLGVTGQLTWPQAATLSLNNTPIRLTALGGNLQFTENSVRGEALTAQLWGQPLRLTLATAGAAAARRLHLRAQSTTPVTELARQVPSPLWANVHGVLAWDLTATLPPPGSTPLTVEYQLASTLKGLAIKLPAPLGKTATIARALDVRGSLIPHHTLTLAGRIGALETRLALSLNHNGVQLTGGHLRVGANAPPVPEAPGFWLLGHVKELNLKDWLQWADTQRQRSDSKNAADKPQRFGVNLRLERLRLGELQLNNVTLKRDPAQPAADLTVKADELAGRVRLASGATRPLTLALERLDLRPLLAAVKERKPARTADTTAQRPAQLPALDVRVADLRWGQTALGRLEVGLRSDATGQQLSHLTLDGGAVLALRGTGDWQRAGDGGGRSQLNLTVDVGNLGTLLRELDEPAAVEAGAAHAALQLRWRGGFNAFMWQQAEGVIDLDIGSGRLPQVEPGLGRLLGVVNLAALNRRLTLDFSDLYGQGFAFERIHGQLRVNAGQAQMAGFTIDGPAGRVLIDGLTDLVARRVDQTVTVEPKLGSGIALAGAVAGGPVVGAAVYLVDRVAGNPFDRLSRYRYRVTGPWREPEFKRIGWESLLNSGGRNAPAPTNHFLDDH